MKNAGVGGELAAKTLERLKSALKSGWARLVIWQVGTNDAIVGVDETRFRATVDAGIAAVRAAGVPLMLIGPQFTLKSPDPARYERFVKIVDDIGVADRVPVLSRYAMMKSWSAKERQGAELALVRRRPAHERSRLPMPRARACRGASKTRPKRSSRSPNGLVRRLP